MAVRQQERFFGLVRGGREALPMWRKPVDERPDESRWLDREDRSIFTDLLYEADYQSGCYRTTLGALADLLERHPQRCRERLERLAGFGLLRFDFPKGHSGVVILDSYSDLVLLTSDQRQAVKAAQAAEHDRLDAKARRQRA